jgi:hypothetical protein
MQVKRILSVFLVFVLFSGCAGLVVDPKSNNAITIFTESLNNVTIMCAVDENKIDLTKEKEDLNQIIKNLNSVIDEKKQYDKAQTTIIMINSTINLLNSWIMQIDKGNTKKVKNYIDSRGKDIIQSLQDLLDNENKK